MTSRAPKSVEERSDRVTAMLLGGAIGDALGSAYEMLASSAIEKHLGSSIAEDFEPALEGSLLWEREPGQPTDDTAMALSVALALASRKPITADLFASRFLEDLDFRSGPFGAMFWNGGPGGATTRALRRLHAGAAAATNGHADDGGNGAAMRAHPVGSLRDRQTALEVAATQAKVTHGHPAAIAAAQAVAALVFDALAGVEPSERPPIGIDDPTFLEAWNDAHRDLTRADRLPSHLRNAAMSGWVTVATAHAISLLYDDEPNLAIGAAAASGGDTDTVASIVGAIVGARHGSSALSSRWIEGLADGTAETCVALAGRLILATDDHGRGFSSETEGS
jgi:ADP-ribosyl-[dinitrogen reductase] hydrolase